METESMNEQDNAYIEALSEYLRLDARRYDGGEGDNVPKTVEKGKSAFAGGPLPDECALCHRQRRSGRQIC